LNEQDRFRRQRFEAHRRHEEEGQDPIPPRAQPAELVIDEVDDANRQRDHDQEALAQHDAD
jgi:hypothetical protein